MATPLATSDDVVTLWRSLSDDETARADDLILRVSARMRQRMPSVDARIAMCTADPTNPAALDPILVADVVASIVKRFMVNINGVAAASEANGVVTLTSTYVNRYDKVGTDTRGTLTITDGDLAPLRPFQPNRRIGSIRFTPGLAPAPVGGYGLPDYTSLTDEAFPARTVL